MKCSGSDKKKIQALFQTYQEVDNDISKFKRWSGLRCIPSCGLCCNNTKVEATVLEVFPLAYDLFIEGKGEYWLKKCEEANQKGVCIFYDRTDSKNKGHCLVYPLRPLLCRLYGFSAKTDKNGRKIFITCSVIKQKYVREIKKILDADESQAAIPIMSYYAGRVLQIDHYWGLKQMPINKAIKIALERVGIILDYKNKIEREVTEDEESWKKQDAETCGIKTTSG